MNLTIETENSTYYIDTVSKTWERAETNGIVGDQPLRTTKGIYNEIGPVELGLPLRLYCDPLPTSKPGTVVRLIETSPVKAYRELR